METAEPGVTKIAFIGTGVMGSPMAGHLRDAGYELTVFNRTRERALGLVEKGAAWASSAGEAAAGADVTISMVG
jgi:3-hydroxyisobutyrate dehydrogenase